MAQTNPTKSSACRMASAILWSASVRVRQLATWLFSAERSASRIVHGQILVFPVSASFCFQRPIFLLLVSAFYFLTSSFPSRPRELYPFVFFSLQNRSKRVASDSI